MKKPSFLHFCTISGIFFLAVMGFLFYTPHKEVAMEDTPNSFVTPPPTQLIIQKLEERSPLVLLPLLPHTLEEKISTIPTTFSFTSKKTDFSIKPPFKLPIENRAISTEKEPLCPPTENHPLPTNSDIDWSGDFHVNVQTFSREEGGYLFSITLSPQSHLKKNRLKNNYFFLIDPSSSIDNKKFQSFKQGISRSLDYLEEGDLFAITLLDKDLTCLNRDPIPMNKKNLAAAHLFLKNLSLPHNKKNKFIDVYTSLNKLSFSALDTQNTAILFSDGNSKLKIGKHQKALNHWLESNQSYVTLYTAAVGERNNLPMLKLFSGINKGDLVYSDTHAGFSRKCAALIIQTKTPLIQNLSLTWNHTDPLTKMEIFPTSSQLPNIFYPQPVVLMGKSEKLIDCTLLIKGENDNKTVYIKKNISFASAQLTKKSLEKKWGLYQAHALYKQFSQEGDSSLLKKAQELLPHDPTYYQR